MTFAKTSTFSSILWGRSRTETDAHGQADHPLERRSRLLPGAVTRTRSPLADSAGDSSEKPGISLPAKVNAWPRDEGLIDYVDAEAYGTESEENTFYAANIIANPTLTVAGRSIDATTIDTELLQSLHEVDEVEANVSTGYHAIEFLLWGQDLNGTGPGAGQRPASDFMTGADCTGGNCDRRRAYLMAATDLLIADLEDIVAAWGPDGEATAGAGGAVGDGTGRGHADRHGKSLVRRAGR